MIKQFKFEHAVFDSQTVRRERVTVFRESVEAHNLKEALCILARKHNAGGFKARSYSVEEIEPHPILGYLDD
jgi:hypothetical protein